MAGSPRRRGSLELRADRIDFTGRVYLPVQQFVQVEWVGSVLLFMAAVVALLWANSPWVGAYHHLWETHLVLDLGIFRIDESLHHWINDGLMAIFFFVVGLEIKRELLHGNLSSPRQAALPAVAALGGMVVPALIYWSLNPSGPASTGWGIPMATDIAFALGVLGLLGRSIPSELRVFLLALAIVDDLGAILVIAVFYTSEISMQALVFAGGFIGVLVAMWKMGVRSWMAYAPVAFLFWASVLESGVHATVAGVVLGGLTPSRTMVDPDEFDDIAPDLLERYQVARAQKEQPEAEATLGKLSALISGTEAPLEALERKFHPLSAYLVLPVFALANSGVELTGEAVSAALTSTVSLGIAAGLVGGKLVGVVLASWLAVKTGLATLPPRVRWIHIAGVALLAGIGFTVALFITQLAFDDPVLVDQGKIGILAASVTAGIIGYLFLKLAPTEEA